MTTTDFAPDGAPAPARAFDRTSPVAPCAGAGRAQAGTHRHLRLDVQAATSVFQNRPFGELLGHAPDGGNDWVRHIHPEDALAFPEHRKRLKSIKPGEVLAWNFRMRHANGDWHHFASRDVLLESDDTGAPKLIVGSASNVRDQRAAEERKNLLIGEMRHRARNLVARIDAIGRQSMPRGDAAVTQFFDAFMGRMRALLDTADAVLSHERRMADLRAVAGSALAPFVSGENRRMQIDGPAVYVTENTAGNLALALHELAAKATKYGALSRDGGSVSLRWIIREQGEKRAVAVEWREQGGPEVVPPSREGYGSRVIRNALRGSDSEVALDFNPSGVHCRICLALPQQP